MAVVPTLHGGGGGGPPGAFGSEGRGFLDVLEVLEVLGRLGCLGVGGFALCGGALLLSAVRLTFRRCGSSLGGCGGFGGGVAHLSVGAAALAVGVAFLEALEFLEVLGFLVSLELLVSSALSLFPAHSGALAAGCAILAWKGAADGYPQKSRCLGTSLFLPEVNRALSDDNCLL